MNMGQSPASSSYNKEKKGIPFFQGNADFGPLHPVTRFYCSEPTKIAHTNDILLSVRAPIGAVNIAEEDCCIGRGLAGLTPHTDVSLKYLYYVLLGKNDELNFKGTGCTFKAINKKSLGETSFPLPPLKEQKRIADILDKAAELISLRKQQIEKLDLLVKSKFIDMFGDPVTNPKGWNVRRIFEVVHSDKNALKAGPFGSSLKKEFYVRSGFKIYGQEQVISGNPSFGDYYIDERKYNELQSCSVKEGDVLISLVGTYGKLLIIPHDFEPGIINPRLMKISFDLTLVNVVYFKCFFMTESLMFFLKGQTHGGTMGILNLGIVKNIKLPVPPLPLQTEFATFVKKVEEQKSQMQTGLEKLELNYKALMVEFFEGE